MTLSLQQTPDVVAVQASTATVLCRPGHCPARVVMNAEFFIIADGTPFLGRLRASAW